MFTTYNQMIEDSTPGRFEGESPMCAYLYELSMNGDTGDDEVYRDGDWSLRYGRRILCGNSQGFVSLVTFSTLSEACAVMDELHTAWEGDDEDN